MGNKNKNKQRREEAAPAPTEAPKRRRQEPVDAVVATSDADDDDESIDFEDPFEDDIESDDVAGEGNNADGDDSDGDGDGDAMMDDDDEDDDTKETKTFRPGIDKLGEGEVLDYDSSAYVMYHALNTEWPCMTFDIYRDSLGVNRSRFPHTMYLVAGTQADTPQNNAIVCLKLSDLHKTKHDEADSNASDTDDDLDDDAIVENRNIRHHGAINRLRLMPQRPNVVATWADTGRVQIIDVADHINSFDRPPQSKLNPNQKPLFSFNGHTTEGFAIDWSPTVESRLVSGDCDGGLFLWEPRGNGGWNVDSKPYTGHKGSIEDLQWSPVENNVFASCSVDGTVKVWDTRNKNTPALSVNAHSADVNVISWNRLVNYLLVSGCDDGSFRIWDLRTFQSGSVEPAAHFQWHQGAITSVEWSPIDGSVVAVSGADDQVTIWDLSLEKEDDVPDVEGVPPQLLFVHQGQQQIKEVHWHKQIPGALVSTALSGFNVFKPENT